MEDKVLIGSLYLKYKLTQEKDGVTYWWYSAMTWLLTDRIKVSRVYPASASHALGYDFGKIFGEC